MICEALKKSYVHKNLHDSFSKKQRKSIHAIEACEKYLLCGNLDKK